MAAFTAIDDAESYFQAVLWTGTGATQSITLGGATDLSPALVWIKQRNGDGGNLIFDTLRGPDKYLVENYTTDEVTSATDNLTAFDTDGFSLGADATGWVNASTDTYVGYNWKAGTTSVPSGGDITPSSVSINTTSKFGIYRYTGTGSADTIAHGLSAVPYFIVNRDISGANEGWVVQHVGKGPDYYLNMDHTRAATDSSSRWNDTAPTSTLFTLGTNNCKVDITYVCYVFANAPGFSKVGAYNGSGQANGPFIYTGFRPAWLLIKNADDGLAGTGTSGSHWVLYDNKRNAYNAADTYFFTDTDVSATTSDAEATGYDIDFLANGFKVRVANISVNVLNEQHIYMAFAKDPLVNSSGVPGNAR